MENPPTAALFTRRDPGIGGKFASWLVPAGLVYFALIGGTGPGELQPILRLVNSASGIGLIVLWMRAAPRHSDALDRAVLGGLLLFLVSGVMARAPHAAFEAAVTTMGYVALLFVTRTLMSNSVIRTRTAQWLGLAGVVLATAYCAIWLLVWFRWLGVGQPAWALFDLPLPAGPYGFKHNVALAAGLLIPFLWVAPSGIPGRVQRAVGVTVLVPVLIIAGSRGLWMGALLATAVVLALQGLRRRRLASLTARQWGVSAAAGLLAVVAVAWLAPDLARAIGVRVGNIGTIGARWDLWAASLAEWNTSILTGVGPGGWPIWLPTTGYFDVTAFSPRHPDSLLFQLLAEIGIVGVAAVLFIVAGVLRTVRATPPTSAIWTAVLLLVASVTANPSDLPFAVVLGIAWLSIAVPRVALATPRAPRPTLARARYALLVAIVVFVGMSSVAGIFHDRARHASTSGDLETARRGLEIAIALDPGLGLYHREQAALLLATDDREGALAALQQAQLLNPADDITMAELAVVWSLGGRNEEAMAAAARAVDLRRSASINHLVLAWVATRGGRSATSAVALADSLVIAPWLAADDAWQVLLGHNGQEQVLDAAAVRATSQGIGLGTGNAVWLAGMSGRDEIVDSAIIKGLQRGSLGAVIALLACDIPRAANLIADAADQEGATFTYWVIRAMVERASGRSSAGTAKIAAFLGPAAVLTSDVPAFASAFGARADDQWVYDRIPIRLDNVGPALPSEEAGLSRWIADPQRTAVTAAPRSGLAHCNG